MPFHLMFNIDRSNLGVWAGPAPDGVNLCFGFVFSSFYNYILSIPLCHRMAVIFDLTPLLFLALLCCSWHVLAGAIQEMIWVPMKVMCKQFHTI